MRRQEDLNGPSVQRLVSIPPDAVPVVGLRFPALGASSLGAEWSPSLQEKGAPPRPFPPTPQLHGELIVSVYVTA